jgi:glyoxylase-like metal-dependent hydrolase (beta-lactamase superfamily II)
VVSRVSRIAIATPWPVGPVNVYLIEDDPLTLIDTGQRSAAALADLEAGLASLGHRVEDLERIVVTHQHIDHCGLAGTLVERSGAELCALDSLAGWMASYPSSLDAEDAFATALLRRHGAPSAAERGDHRGGGGYGEAVRVTHRLREGDELEFAARRLLVLFRPGHSPYDTVLHDEERGMLFGGDHLLPWPSSAILTPSGQPGARNGRPRALATYKASLRATGGLALDAVLPGHGEVVRDHRGTIAERLRRYARITEQTADAVTAEPRTAAEIAAALKGPVADPKAFFVLSDVLGHLDELIDAGAVAEAVDAGGVSRFVRA